MVNNLDENESSEKRSIESEIGASPCCAGGAEASSFFGGDMKQMMQGCPCKGFLEDHPWAVRTALSVAGLGVLLLLTGWVLGISAFFLTI